MPQGPANITSVRASQVSGYVVIASTGTAVRLPSGVLSNGLVVKSISTNAAQTSTYSGKVGGSNVDTIINNSTSVTGYLLAPGEAASYAVSNANILYVNGTAGDIFTYEGN